MKALPNKRICIVAPIDGAFVPRDDAGRFCFELASTCDQAPNVELTVLFSGLGLPRAPNVQERELDWPGATATLPEDMHGGALQNGNEWFGARSQRIMEWLRKRSFDFILFQDVHANAFITVQAKRTGLGFSDTTLAVMVHQPSRWSRVDLGVWPKRPFRECKMDYMEDYCASHADLVLTPTSFLRDWAVIHGWPAEKMSVLPYPFHDKALITSPADVGRAHWAIVVENDTRSCLATFCEALDELIAEDEGPFPDHLTFIRIVEGKENDDAFVHVRDAGFRAKDRRKSALNFAELSRSEVSAYIKSVRATAVFPSSHTLTSYVLLDCYRQGLLTLAPNANGIAELVPEEHLFEHNVQACKKALQRAVLRPQMPVERDCNQPRTKPWLNLLSNLPRAPKPVRREQPLVSVCIAHYNHAKYLPALLASIGANDYPRFEVVIIDDGSPSRQSREVFEEQKRIYAQRGWTFLSQSNRGASATLNRAFQRSRGDYVIFMDSDNVARPAMISDFVHAMQTTGDDFISCHFGSFEGDEDPGEHTQLTDVFAPLGPIIEAGIIDNVFGDTNFCARRTAFQELKGFTSDRTGEFKDWELLARAALSGYKLDVLPKLAIFYRRLPGSVTFTTNRVHNHQQALKPFMDGNKVDMRKVVLDLLVPMHRHVLDLEIHCNKLVADHNQAMFNMRVQLNADSDAIRSLERDRESCTLQIYELECEVAKGSVSADSATKQVAALQRQIAEHERNLRTEMAKNSQLREQLSDVTTILASSEQTMASQSIELDNLRKAKERTTHRIATRVDELLSSAAAAPHSRIVRQARNVLAQKTAKATSVDSGVAWSFPTRG